MVLTNNNIIDIGTNLDLDIEHNLNVDIENTSSKSSGKNLKMIGIIIVVFILVLVGIYFGYKYIKNKNNTGKKTEMLISGLYDGSKTRKISANILPGILNANEFAINFWIFISDYSYNFTEAKKIFVRKDKDESEFTIQLDENDNTMSIIITTNQKGYTDMLPIASNSPLTTVSNFLYTSTNSPSDSMLNREKFKIRDFPLQKWVNVNITLMGSSLDIFMDGYLKYNFLLSGIPKLPIGNVYISPKLEGNLPGGFNGYLSNMAYTNKSLSMPELIKIYKNGPLKK